MTRKMSVAIRHHSTLLSATPYLWEPYGKTVTQFANVVVLIEAPTPSAKGGYGWVRVLGGVRTGAGEV
jgi:hypothetical protein